MKKNKIILVVLFLVVVAFSLYFYLYKGHRNIGSEKESYFVSSISIYDEFKKDETKSNHKYLDKTIEVYGKISSMDLPTHTIILDDKLIAVFAANIPSNLKEQSSIKIKGRFIGYDDLLEELKMDQCVLVTP